MRSASTGMTILLALAAFAMLLPASPAPMGAGHSTSVGAPIGAPSVGHVPASEPALLASGHGLGLAPTPKITCPAIPPTAWGYGAETPVSGVYPLSPALSYQTPCPIISQDEIHGSFFSSQAYSGERLNVPIYLPPDGANNFQNSAYLEMYVGMIVAGNPSSEWHQSYAEVVFIPGSGSYSEYVAVWSLVNDSVYGGNSSEVGVWKCPTNSMYMSWNNSFFCEVEEVGTPSLGSVPAGSFVNVTFAGEASKTSPRDLHVWVNDSTTTGYNYNYLFSKTSTGSYDYYPFYNASCQDTCIVHWASAFGLGIGYESCPLSTGLNPPCDSYTESWWRGMPPAQFGSPEYYVSGSYTGDYYYFAPESTSGVCNTVATSGTVAQCEDFLSVTGQGGTGYYPYFTFNGSGMNFGSNWTWTTQTWGGATFEFYSNGAQHDIIPFFFYTTTNSSLAGFVGPNQNVTVDATVQDWGSTSSVTLQYQLPGSTFTSLAMSRVHGNAVNGTYQAVIPSTGGNGLLNYTVTALNGAGAQIFSPAVGAFHVRRGPLPTFTVNVTTNLQSCGGVVFNGTLYKNGTTISTTPGYFSLFGKGCYPWNFTTWTPYGGVRVLPNWSDRTRTIEVFGDGAIAAKWQYYRPFDNITAYTSPTGCGSVTIGNQTLKNGQSTLLPDGLPAYLNWTSCGTDLFSGYTVVGNLTILGPQLTPHENGSVTANFLAATSAISIVFFTQPSSCGGVLYRGAGYTNGESLGVAAGSYPIAPDPCAHYGFLNWTTTGGISVNGGTITVSSGGTITEVNYHLTEVTFVIDPFSCGYVTWDGTPYRDGAVLSVANNSTHVVYGIAYSGCYLIALTGTGGVHVAGNVAVVNGSGELIVTFGRGAPNQFIGFLTSPPTCGSILFNNQAYSNSNYTYVAPGYVATITAQPCAGYGWTRWNVYGNISIVGNTAWLNSSGAIEAVFEPVVSIFLSTLPSSCGSIVFAGTAYTNATVPVPELNTYSLRAVPCAGYAFSDWVNTTGLEISGNLVYVLAGGFLTAVFNPIRYAVTFDLHPAACGLLKVNNLQFGNGTTLSLTGGSYPVQTIPCLGDHIDHWEVTGNLSVSGNQLWVNGSGTVVAVFLPVPPTLTLSVPPSSLSGSAVELIATIAVPVPPFNYNYTWTFGDGTTLVTPVDFTTHTYSGTGTYTVHVSVRDPYNRTANASAPISIVAGSAGQALQFTPVEITALGVAAAAVALIAIAALWRQRASRPPPEPPALGPSGERMAGDTIPTSETEAKP